MRIPTPLPWERSQRERIPWKNELWLRAHGKPRESGGAPGPAFPRTMGGNSRERGGNKALDPGLPLEFFPLGIGGEFGKDPPGIPGVFPPWNCMEFPMFCKEAAPGMGWRGRNSGKPGKNREKLGRAPVGAGILQSRWKSGNIPGKRGIPRDSSPEFPLFPHPWDQEWDPESMGILKFPLFCHS